jgi:haloalkane dehalogenase
MDHIGFGLSAKPSPYDYSTPNHSRTLEEFITKKQLTDITLVVHDFGGPIGLRYAIDNPERVKRIVIMNSWLWSAEGDPDFEKMIHLLRSPLLPLLYRYLNFSPRILLPGSFAQRKIQSSAHRHYLKPFLKRSEREGPLAFARSLLNDQRWFESLWERRVTIADKPVLFVWGMKDPVIKPVYLEKFMSGFPNHTVVSLATCGHFPQEENPDEVVEALTSFLRMKN